MDRKVERIWVNVGEGKEYDQNILLEKHFKAILKNGAKKKMSMGWGSTGWEKISVS